MRALVALIAAPAPTQAKVGRKYCLVSSDRAGSVTRTLYPFPLHTELEAQCVATRG